MPKKIKAKDCDFNTLSVSISFSKFDCIYLFSSILIWWLLFKGRDRVIFCFLLPCLAACFVVYVLAVGCAGWMGKGVAFARFLGSIRKRRKLYMFLVMLSLGFFERLVWLLWRVVGGLSPLKFVEKEGNFCIFGLGKGSVYGVMEGWNSGSFWGS